MTLFSCSQRHVEKFDLAQIPQNWTHLTQTDSGLVIYNSCDAGNLLISLKDNSEILFHGQQEDYEFEIIEALKTKNDTIRIKTNWKGTSDVQTFNMKWVDKQKGLIQMVSADPNSIAIDFVFVDKQLEKAFPTFDQPCKECWPEEGCE